MSSHDIGEGFIVYKTIQVCIDNLECLDDELYALLSALNVFPIYLRFCVDLSKRSSFLLAGDQVFQY